MIGTIFKVYWEQWKKNFFYKESKKDGYDTPKVGLLKAIKSMNQTQWIAFIAAYAGMILEALDFFTTTLSVTQIATEFKVEPSAVTSAITTTMMLRPVGALLFGAVGDRLGRRWPLVAGVLLFSVVNLGSGFAPDLQTFIALRALFGIIMGAEWGLGTSIAFESLPIEVRGLFSGIYQEGWAVGCLLATFISFVLTEYNKSWRALFWVGSALSIPTIILRCFLKETEAFVKSKEARRVIGRSFLQETWLSIKHNWYRLIYMFLVMGFLNFMGHATQDLYPTYLTTQLGYSNSDRTITIVIYNIGAIVGGAFWGSMSNRWGRRLCIAICCACAGAVIPLWTYSGNKSALQFGSFLMQFFVQGGLGCGPAHLGELSPPSLRTTAPGMAYQLGNLLSSASSQIEAVLGEKYPLRRSDGSIVLDTKGSPVADYGYTQSILSGIVCGIAFFVAVFMGVSEERNKDYLDKVIEDSRSERSAAVSPCDIERGADSDEQMNEGKIQSDMNDKNIWIQHNEHPITQITDNTQMDLKSIHSK
ncbi:major facilitator superfamily domain-containing protein [Halteromyces radiatus]|uniref:major facilitator superfamily domain-containing protein n=1 Tax=Halteromyces radiatus TaxID=101107 RepID=UPI00221F32EC|nr:major facilitator superfamily domain-containing protein [Halteromyces radiatus]KAI8085042.1 major facilitator superfamily domain-containing protein [Halteromyces radiatus]